MRAQSDFARLKSRGHGLHLLLSQFDVAVKYHYVFCEESSAVKGLARHGTRTFYMAMQSVIVYLIYAVRESGAKSVHPRQ